MFYSLHSFTTFSKKSLGFPNKRIQDAAECILINLANVPSKAAASDASKGHTAYGEIR